VLSRCEQTSGDWCGAVPWAWVACHDLGEFATHYPAGRFLVQDIGGKEHAMRLMVHADGEVRKQALLCVQKLLAGRHLQYV